MRGIIAQNQAKVGENIWSFSKTWYR